MDLLKSFYKKITSLILCFFSTIGLATGVRNLTGKDQKRLGIIGGADGPTAVFISNKDIPEICRHMVNHYRGYFNPAARTCQKIYGGLIAYEIEKGIFSFTQIVYVSRVCALLRRHFSHSDVFYCKWRLFHIVCNDIIAVCNCCYLQYIGTQREGLSVLSQMRLQENSSDNTFRHTGGHP